MPSGSITWIAEVPLPWTLECRVPLNTIVPRSFQSGWLNPVHGLVLSMSRVQMTGSVWLPRLRNRHCPADAPAGISVRSACPRSFGSSSRGNASAKSITFSKVYVGPRVIGRQAIPPCAAAWLGTSEAMTRAASREAIERRDIVDPPDSSPAQDGLPVLSSQSLYPHPECGGGRTQFVGFTKAAGA